MSDSVIQIPLTKLSSSPLNVRKKDRKADINALAASVLAHGLLQNLNVVAKDDDKFEVVAGGRRLAALKALVKAGAIARDFAVPCKVLPSEAAREASLAENIQRVDMDAMDEVDAFGQLVEEGASPEDVAKRFGVTLRHVQQRLALSKLSPKIKNAWKRGEVTLEAARAFCLVDDHAQQEAVFKSLGKPITQAAPVRARLMSDRMRGNNRLAVFVGLEAYEKAGGVAVRDLFDDKAVYVDNPALMTKLAEEKLQGLQSGYARHGWGWVEVNLSGARVSGSRIHPDLRDYTPEEETELKRLRGELDALDEAIEADSIEDDPRWDQRDELAGQIETIRQDARIWDLELMKLAGVVLSVDHDGDLDVTLGVVGAEDEKAVQAVRRAQREALASEDGDDEGSEDADDQRDDEADEMVTESGLPKIVILDLSQTRTRAIRSSLIRSPHVALAVAVAAMLARSVLRFSLPGVDISARNIDVADFNDTHEVAQEVIAGLPESDGDILAWCLEQSVEKLLDVLAMLTAVAVDLSHEKGTHDDRVRQSMANELCRALAVDMRQAWQADSEFWSRLPKSELMAAIETSQKVSTMSQSKRTEFLKTCAKLKKDELAAKVEDAFAGEHYLPDLFKADADEVSDVDLPQELAA